MNLEYVQVSGAAVSPLIDELAQLRIRVFAEWPYLYNGNLAYERKYLQPYEHSARSVVVLVRNEGRAVGATTGLPMSEAPPEMQAPFLQAEADLAALFYFGESVVLREYRGLGMGREFFARRESHAQASGFSECVFCAVDRDPHDVRRPAGYEGNDVFWAHRGYRKDIRFKCVFPWVDIGDTAPTQKTMTFWTRSIDGGNRRGIVLPA